MLTELADKMAERSRQVDGKTTCREFDIKESVEVFFGSHSYSTKGDLGVFKSFDSLGALKELRLVNPDYCARIGVAKTGEMVFRGATSSSSHPDKYSQLKRSYFSQHPSRLHCQFGSNWLPNSFRSASVVDGPHSESGGICLLVRGPCRDSLNRVIFDETTFNVVVNKNQMRLVSAHYVEYTKPSLFRDEDPMKRFPFHVPTTTSIRYANWVESEGTEYPTLLIHGKVDAGDPNTASDDTVVTSGYTHIQFESNANFDREEAFLTFYGIQEPH